MVVNFINLNYFLFFIEYFVVIIIIYILVVYLLILGNIFNIITQNILNNSLILIFLLLNILILNDIIFYLIDLNCNFLIILNKSLIFDYISIIMKLLLVYLSFFFFLIVSNLFKYYKLTFFELLLLFLFIILGLIILNSSYNLLLIFIAIELISFSCYFLVALKKNYYYILECSIKYIIINSLSGSFFLLGSLLIYYSIGSICVSNIHIFILKNEYLFTIKNNIIIKKLVFKIEYFIYYLNFIDFKFWFFEYMLINNYLLNNTKFIIELGILFILVSLLIKLFYSPFHIWAIQIYEKTSSIIIFFFLLIIKLGYFIILFRISFFLLNIEYLNIIILIIGLISIITGSYSNLKQKKVKTLLVYSSITHMGYILLVFSINSFFSLEIFCFYLINYLLSNIIIWFIILSLIKKDKIYINKYSKNITDFIVLNKINKTITFGLFIVLFSIGGMPPFIGFFAKLGIFLVLISEKLFSLIIIVSFCSIISIFYYIRLIKIIYFENLLVGKLYFPIGSFNIFIFCFFSSILIFLFFNPKLIYLIIHKITLIDKII